MADKDLKTEEKILEAAADEFLLKGKSGARMQEIANNAGINKALLHYYYRSKDKLFESVFTVVIKKLLLSKVNKIIEEEKDAIGLVRRFVATYIDIINKNPMVPFFVLEEITKNPGRLTNSMLNSGLPIDKVINLIHDSSKQGIIREIEPQQLIINILSMSIFPVIGRNMFQPILFNDNKKAFDQFLETRKTEVADFIIRSIQPEK
jgi:AcrR family transcriptional regulator